ncbi:unnamed protein product [Diatraea saccharalis]|uniref:Uncharacterized protein n=1 Tax=Diatraea saccharalis TaxID=40085 RepID=A0A9N9N0N5_9NEOP|nr:unnamed protein product [Diatraea saccharalis]
MKIPGLDDLTVQRQIDRPKRVVCGLLVPGTRAPHMTAKLLRHQNKFADVDRCILHKAIEGDDNTFFIFSTTRDVAEKILARGRRLCYLMGSVYVDTCGYSVYVVAVDWPQMMLFLPLVSGKTFYNPDNCAPRTLYCLLLTYTGSNNDTILFQRSNNNNNKTATKSKCTESSGGLCLHAGRSGNTAKGSG